MYHDHTITLLRSGQRSHLQHVDAAPDVGGNLCRDLARRGGKQWHRDVIDQHAGAAQHGGWRKRIGSSAGARCAPLMEMNEPGAKFAFPSDVFTMPPELEIFGCVAELAGVSGTTLNPETVIA